MDDMALMESVYNRQLKLVSASRTLHEYFKCNKFNGYGEYALFMFISNKQAYDKLIQSTYYKTQTYEGVTYKANVQYHSINDAFSVYLELITDTLGYYNYILGLVSKYKCNAKHANKLIKLIDTLISSLVHTQYVLQQNKQCLYCLDTIYDIQNKIYNIYSRNILNTLFISR